MANAKLSLNTTPEKAQVAAFYSEVKLGKAVKLGDSLRLEVSYKNGQQLADFVLLTTKVQGNEPIELPVEKEASSKPKK